MNDSWLDHLAALPALTEDRGRASWACLQQAEALLRDTHKQLRRSRHILAWDHHEEPPGSTVDREAVPGTKRR